MMKVKEASTRALIALIQENVIIAMPCSSESAQVPDGLDGLSDPLLDDFVVFRRIFDVGDVFRWSFNSLHTDSL